MNIPLTDRQIEALWRYASQQLGGFLREDPRKAWTLNEKKAAVREFIQQLADDNIKRDC